MPCAGGGATMSVAMGSRSTPLLVILGAIFGGSFLFMRVAAPVLGPWVVAEGRVLIAALALAPFVGRVGIGAAARDWRAYAVLGFFNAALPFGLISFAEVEIGASLASIVNAATPLSTAIVASAWLGQPLTPRRVGAIAIGVAGVAVLVGWNPVDPTPAMLLAVGAALVATFGYAIGLSYARRRFAGDDPLMISFGQLAAASVILAPGALLTLPSSASGEAMGSVLALGLVSTALAWPLVFRLAAPVGPTATSTVTFLAPVFGTAWGALLLHEPIGPGLAVGAVLVLVSLLLLFGIRLPRPLRAAPATA